MPPVDFAWLWTSYTEDMTLDRNINKHRPWTADDDAELRSVLAAGRGAIMAGAKLKRSTVAIISRSRALNLSVARKRVDSGLTKKRTSSFDQVATTGEARGK